MQKGKLIYLLVKTLRSAKRLLTDSYRQRHFIKALKCNFWESITFIEGADGSKMNYISIKNPM